MIRKGSLVKITDKATGIFERFVGQCFKADCAPFKQRDMDFITIQGIGIPVAVVQYMGPQKKGKKQA
jgi:hypothetical protein